MFKSSGERRREVPTPVDPLERSSLDLTETDPVFEMSCFKIHKATDVSKIIAVYQRLWVLTNMY